MRRLAWALLLLAGCTWSNSLYQARRLSNSAAKAEREERSFDAGSIWGQVAVKAESAYARNAGGAAGAEALWLRGRALAHLGDCPGAIPLLERSRFAPEAGAWRDPLILELGRCRVLGEDPEGALATLEPLLTSDDPALRREAGLLIGRALADAGRWREAADRLADDESLDGRWQRAIALAELGRGAEALEVVAPRLAANDSIPDWARLLRALAREELPVADRLVDALMNFPRQGDTARARWLLATATGARRTAPVESRRRLEAVLALGATPSAPLARLTLVEQLIEEVTDEASLRRVLGVLRDHGRGDVTTAFTVARYARFGERLLADLDSIPPGAAEGDLAMWFDAALARDSLASVPLADWILQRLERGWPASPYLPKVLLARIAMRPDSAEALRGRLAALGDSEYLAYLRGTETARFAALEDSLGFYLDGRWAEFFPGRGAAGFGDDQ